MLLREIKSQGIEVRGIPPLRKKTRKDGAPGVQFGRINVTDEIPVKGIVETSQKYRSVVCTRRGSPEVLEIVENDLRLPLPGQVRIRVLACCVCLPDVQARYGQSPFAPKIPFVPGYAIVGIVDVLGKHVSGPTVGDRVAALTIYGGYAEYIYLRQGKLIPVPAKLDPAEAVTLVLNYIVAFQALHRSAKVKAGDTVLIIGASGGIGTAFLELGRLAGLKMYGIASGSKHQILASYGAMSRLSWKWRKHSSVKIAERTYEKRAQALHC